MRNITRYAKKWNRDASNNFSAACYSGNTMEELIDAIREEPCFSSMSEWQITADEYKDAIKAAYADRIADEEENNKNETYR